VLAATARRLRRPVSAVDLPSSLWNAEELRALLGGAGFRRIAIVPDSLDARFPSPERVVHLAVVGAAAAIPAFARLAMAAHSALAEAVALEVETLLQSYCDGDRLKCPMWAHTAIAYRE
jgi:hypothetical protein